MPGPNVRSSYPVVARAALRMSHGARAWEPYTSTSLVSALKSKRMSACMGLVYFRVLVSALKSKCGSCPLPELGFWAEAHARELQLHVPKLGNLDSAAQSWDWITGGGSSDVGRSGRSNVAKRAIVAIENLALDAESGVLQFFTFDETGNPL